MEIGTNYKLLWEKFPLKEYLFSTKIIDGEYKDEVIYTGFTTRGKEIIAIKKTKWTDDKVF